MTVLNQKEMATSTVVIATLVEHVAGHTWVYIIPYLICLVCVSALIAINYSQSRFLISASREEQLPAIFGLIHRNKRTPVIALLYVGLTGTIIMISYGEHLEALMHYVNMAYWIEYALGISTLIVFRYRWHYVERPYKVWITTPIFMICFSIILIIFSFINQPLNTGIVIAVMMSGVPVYYICVKKKWLSFLQLDKLCCKIMKVTGFVECKSG